MLIDLNTPEGRREAARLGLIDAASEPTLPASCQWSDEAAFMADIIALAKRGGWKVYHVLIAKKSEAGWPDLILLRSGKMIAAECKMPGQMPTAAQEGWLSELEKVPGVLAVCWHPADWPQIQEVLR